MEVKTPLVVIEGIDGSGKSVQAVLLQMALMRQQYAAVITKAKQPEQNSALKNFTEAFGIRPDGIAYMFLYQALHRQQYEEAINALAEGKVAIADRWDASFFVYHNLVGPMAKRQSRVLKTLNSLAFEGRRPDVGFYLDVPVSVALERRILRGDKIQSLTDESQFYKRVAKEYKKLFEGKGYHRIDGTLPIEEIAREMLEVTLVFIRG